MSDRLYDVAIVGAGPAGLTAALYAGRNQMQAVLIEAKVPGGQLLNTDLIEDYPGHTSIRGADLAQVLTEQAEHFDTELLIAEARRIRAVPGGLQVVETDSGEITAKAVIITAGGNPRKLGVPPRSSSPGAASRTAPSATARSSAGSTSRSWAEVMRPSRRRSSSHAMRAGSP